MRRGIFYTFIAGVVSVAVITVALVILLLTGIIRNNPYVRVADASVIGDAKQAAVGDVYVFRIDSRESIKLQKKQCVNMEGIVTGDSFKVVIVNDVHNIIQCIVRVDD